MTYSEAAAACADVGGWALTMATVAATLSAVGIGSLWWRMRHLEQALRAVLAAHQAALLGRLDAIQDSKLDSLTAEVAAARREMAARIEGDVAVALTPRGLLDD